MERLRAANDKLRYRLNLLKVATQREEQLLQGNTGGAGQPGQGASNCDHPSLGHSNSNSYNYNNNTTMLPSPDTINTRLARDSDEKLPFKVEYREGVGNFVVASRDIQPNEVRVYGFMAYIYGNLCFVDNSGGPASSAGAQL